MIAVDLHFNYNIVAWYHLQPHIERLPPTAAVRGRSTCSVATREGAESCCIAAASGLGSAPARVKVRPHCLFCVFLTTLSHDSSRQCGRVNSRFRANKAFGDHCTICLIFRSCTEKYGRRRVPPTARRAHTHATRHSPQPLSYHSRRYSSVHITADSWGAEISHRTPEGEISQKSEISQGG